MKTRIFKIVFPMLAFLIAISGAFAFNNAPAKKSAQQFIGHIKVDSDCEETGVLCQDEFNGKPCQSGGTNLYKLNGSTCPNQLWKIE